MDIPQDFNSLVNTIIQELDPGTMVIVKLFDAPNDQNENPNAEDPFETRGHLSMASGGGNANYESHVPFTSQGLPFSI